MSGWYASRAERRELERQNAKRPEVLAEIPRVDWPSEYRPQNVTRVLRSRDFLVQVYDVPQQPTVLCRLSIMRTQLGDAGRWVDGITWDDLQRLKREAGYGEHDAVEVFPNDRHIVNVANMRHLWVMAEPLPFVWR